MATEKKHRSILYEEHSVHKIEMITPKIGMVYSGMGPDYRLLVRQARKMAQQYWVTYQEQIPTAQLVQRVAMLMQEYTQSGYVSINMSSIHVLEININIFWNLTPN